MGGLGGWAPAPALFRTIPDMMVFGDVRFNGDGTGVGADDGVRGKVIVGREGTVSKPGSIFVRSRGWWWTDTLSGLVRHVRRPQVNSCRRQPQELRKRERTLVREGKRGKKMSWWSTRSHRSVKRVVSKGDFTQNGQLARPTPQISLFVDNGQ